MSATHGKMHAFDTTKRPQRLFYSAAGQPGYNSGRFRATTSRQKSKNAKIKFNNVESLFEASEYLVM